MGFSCIDPKEQFVIADDAILNEDFIEIDGETDFYAQDKSNTEEFDCDKMMQIVFHTLYEKKRIIVNGFHLVWTIVSLFSLVLIRSAVIQGIWHLHQIENLKKQFPSRKLDVTSKEHSKNHLVMMAPSMHL